VRLDKDILIQGMDISQVCSKNYSKISSIIIAQNIQISKKKKLKFQNYLKNLKRS